MCDASDGWVDAWIDPSLPSSRHSVSSLGGGGGKTSKSYVETPVASSCLYMCVWRFVG